MNRKLAVTWPQRMHYQPQAIQFVPLNAQNIRAKLASLPVLNGKTWRCQVKSLIDNKTQPCTCFQGQCSVRLEAQKEGVHLAHHFQYSLLLGDEEAYSSNFSVYTKPILEQLRLSH